MDSLLHGIIIIITILYTTPHNTHYLIYTLYTSHNIILYVCNAHKRVWKKKGLLLLFLLLSLLLFFYFFFYDPINIPIRSVTRVCAHCRYLYHRHTYLSITRARARSLVQAHFVFMIVSLLILLPFVHIYIIYIVLLLLCFTRQVPIHHISLNLHYTYLEYTRADLRLYI